SGNRRRRQEVMPGGWLWLVVLLMLVGVLYFALGIGQGGLIPYPDFQTLAREGKVKKVRLIGNKLLDGELREDAKINDEELKKRIRNNRFQVRLNEGAVISGQVTKFLDDNHILYVQEEDSSNWLGPLLLLLVPALILLAFFFFFLMPRFRDPL